MKLSKSDLKTRAERERAAFDSGSVHVVGNFYRRRTQLFQYPNRKRQEQLFQNLALACARKARVLEIGCGTGSLCAWLFHSVGASHVLGIDISEKAIEEARRLEISGKVEFLCQDIMNMSSDRFDLILGRSILHHVDYKTVLPMLYERSLVEGGTLLFMEPLGENIILSFFHLVARNAHTPDERPFMYRDLLWLQTHFPGAQIFPFNYASLLFGIMLSVLGIKVENNIIMLAADRVDRWLSKNAAFLRSRFRVFILVIEKEARGN
jgi:SAM-dependent methyltransferase